MINHTFSDISYNPDSSYPVYCYATSQFTDRQLIINDPIAYRVVLVNAKNKVIIISLPQYYLNMATCLASANPGITNQLPIRATAMATIPNSMFPY